jgi:hypothetical protein
MGHSVSVIQFITAKRSDHDCIQSQFKCISNVV